MSKVIKYMPELQGDEQLTIAQLMKEMSEEQAEQFARVYRQRRKDETTVLLTTLLAFVGIAGVNRFYVGQIGMGLAYLFTAGFCLIGTIVDIFNYKSLTNSYNENQALEVDDSRRLSNDNWRVMMRVVKSGIFPLLALMLVIAACEPPPPPITDARLAEISLPDGFEISVFADSVENARSMVLSPGGVLFVGTRRAGVVHALVDRNEDGYAEERYVIAEDLNMPNGVAFRDGSLYVAEVNRILRYDGIEGQLGWPPEPVVVVDDLPTDRHHGWKYINFGPDGKLYVPVGAPCNACDRELPYASILRMNPDGSGKEVYASGIRNSLGFTWHPETGEMWFTDNGRDNMGDDVPPCELNHAPVAGLHFGFPYIHGMDIPDPEFGEGRTPSEFALPAQPLGAHVSPLGLEFVSGAGFPASFQNRILIAEHGSWNRSKKVGYRISMVSFDTEGNADSYEPFATGWLQGEEAWGRPVDLEFLLDGSLLVSDDQEGMVYRIKYTD